MAWESVITDGGLSMLEQIAAGGSVLNLTKVVTGKGTVSSADLHSQTAVSSIEDATTGVLTRKIESDGVRISVRIYSYTEEYTMKQIGIYGKVDNGNETLFALLQNTDGIDILAYANFPDFAFNISLFVESANASSFTATVNTNALVSQGQLNEALSNVVSLTRSYYASTSSVSCPFSENSKTYLVWTAGAANDGMDDASYGSVFIVSNGKYSQIKKGTAITVSISGGTFTVTSTTSVAMGVIEL